MKAIHLFQIGLAIDILILIILISNLFMMQTSIFQLEGSYPGSANGFSPALRIVIWLIPLLLLGLMGLAYWLKNTGKLLAANILLWIPALPLVGGIMLWGGLALLFAVSSIKG